MSVQRVSVKRYWRPEDISLDLAYRTDFEEIFADAGPALDVSMEDIVGTCSIREEAGQAAASPGEQLFNAIIHGQHIECSYAYLWTNSEVT